MPGIPAWARAHLDETLPGNPVLGGRALSRRMVLASTRQGAVLLRRGLLGGVTHEMVETPQGRVAFRCGGCGHNLQFYGLALPATVYCSLCAAKFHVDGQGNATDAGGQPLAPPPHPGQDPGVAGAKEAAVGPAAPASPAARFTHNGYTLYRRDVETKAGTRPLYFFSKGQPRSGEASALPEGHEVGVNARTGLPFLRRSPATPGEGARTGAKAVGTRRGSRTRT